jgi:hypothetical protein
VGVRPPRKVCQRLPQPVRHEPVGDAPRAVSRHSPGSHRRRCTSLIRRSAAVRARR